MPDSQQSVNVDFMTAAAIDCEWLPMTSMFGIDISSGQIFFG